MSTADSSKAVNAIVDSIMSALKKGNEVVLIGFGSFSVSKRAARKGRNPRTGQTMTIKTTKVPRFTAGRAFKDAVK